MGIVNGQLKRLKRGHPALFDYLIGQTAMGEELGRIRGVLSKSDSPLGFNLNELF
jgi:hypothetical protein